jgi:hypothetical protein
MILHKGLQLGGKRDEATVADICIKFTEGLWSNFHMQRV